MELLDRFINYVKIDTQSDDASTSAPSTQKQFDLAKLLKQELEDLGVSNVTLDDNCIVMGTIPANIEGKPTIGYIAHMDTSPDCSGTNVKPRVISNYDGNDIELNKDTVMKIDTFPVLKEKKGKTLIVTDGTTLLGADDKAGVAEIMTFVEYIMSNPDVKHGTIKVAFTPDEEVGRGTENFDVAKFGCDFAYTVDGGEVSYIEYENFNAAACSVKIYGVSVHPGSAKHKMINAIEVGMKFHSLLPEFDKPQYTQGFEGFNHLCDIKGGVEYCQLDYILRNHNKNKLEKQKSDFERAAAYINSLYGEGTCVLDMKDQYRNMIEILKDHMEVVYLAEKAIRTVGLQPESMAIRGGTDGANLTFMGLPCPNLGTGGYNYHGRFEFAVYEEMLQSVKILKAINEENCK
ncbi:MAG: peptidase T [Erysipelotrichales bacterium]|nr:peptidase T [Erysipelotrichales bacterium]